MNEEALARWGLSSQEQTNKQTNHILHANSVLGRMVNMKEHKYYVGVLLLLAELRSALILLHCW